MVCRSFDVCGITSGISTRPSKVRSGDLYEKCMQNAKLLLEEQETEDEDPFEL